MPTTPRKPNPQDSTRRNDRASAKRDAALLVRLKQLERRMDSFFELWSMHQRQILALTQELRKAAKRR